MKLTIHLVTWNGEKFIPLLFDSIKTGIMDYESRIVGLHIFDNGSTDRTVELIKKEISDLPMPCALTESRVNLGFAGGHNKLFETCDRRYATDGFEYVLLLNQDLRLEPDCIAKLVETLNKSPELAAVGPRLMRLTSAIGLQILTANPTSEVRNPKSDVIDSLGLTVCRSRRVIDQFAGRRWPNVKCQMPNVMEIFGVSGAMPMFRLSALRDIAFPDGAIFDASHGSYKEDVDLAFRLRSRGYGAGVVLDAVAYHARGSGQATNERINEILKNKRTQLPFVRRQSYRNHLAVIFKNEYWQNLLLDLPFILWYEGSKLLYCVFFDRQALRGLVELWKMRHELVEKMRWAAKKRKVNWKDMRKWYA